jgi:hypothetical protein
MTEMKISQELFVKAALECVPQLRKALEEMGLDTHLVSPSMSMTGTLYIDGREERIKVEVTLDPEDPRYGDDD